MNYDGSQARRGFLLILLLIAVLVEPVLADTAVCTGLHFPEDENPWNLLGIDVPERREANCAPDHAFMAVHLPRGVRREGKHIQVLGSCCPLPKGVLSRKHSYELDACPENAVVTGVKQERQPGVEETLDSTNRDPKNWRNVRLQYIRCTALESDVAELSKRSKGYSLNFSRHFRGYFRESTTRARMPLALRFGLGRLAKDRWTDSICVGLPWGSVLVAKAGKECADFSFANILPKTEEGTLLPDCIALHQPYSQTPRCETAPEERQAGQ